MAYLGRKGASAALTSADIPDNSITAAKIVDGAVAAGDLASDVVISTTGAITTTGAFTSIGIDDNAVGAVAITIDADERVGIGVSPPADMLASYTNIAFGGNSTMQTNNSATVGASFYISQNAYRDTDPNWKRITDSDEASQYVQNNGVHKFNYVASGSGDITWVEAMRIGATGNVGISTSAPAVPLHVKKETSGTTDLLEMLRIDRTSSGTADVGMGSSINFYSELGASDPTATIEAITTHVANKRGRLTFRARDGAGWPANFLCVDSYLGVGIGTTSDTAAALNIRDDSSYKIRTYSTSTATGHGAIGFSNGNGGVGGITTSASSTAYETTSDYRLKENVVEMSGAIGRLKLLKPSRFNFIVDPDKTVDGFLAHEAQEVVPESVTGTKDAMTEAVLYVEGDELPEGKSIGDIKTASVPDMQGIDQAKLVPLLVGALQEAIARIETLENA